MPFIKKKGGEIFLVFKKEGFAVLFSLLKIERQKKEIKATYQDVGLNLKTQGFFVSMEMSNIYSKVVCVAGILMWWIQVCDCLFCLLLCGNKGNRLGLTQDEHIRYSTDNP